MAATYGSGGSSPPVIGRPVERVFEEAQTTGEINLSGRKLKDYPRKSPKYDLADTIVADLSKNRLQEFPQEICEYSSIEKINCYHNCIKSIPETIIHLQQLTHLNLSRNQLTVLPSYIGGLISLEVLIAANNKLVSLPEEIGMLEKLMELDVSCNEISHLPLQLGDLSSLRSLNVRRNFLVELPLEISRLNLRKVDFSSNRIEKIPSVFRKIDTLEEIILDNNPLISPAAHICTKGRQHIMKFLQIMAIKEDRKRGILHESEMKRLVRKSLPPQQTSDEFRNMVDNPDTRWKRHTVLSSDSGYSTTDSLEKCGWTPSEVSTDIDAANSLAMKAAEAVREHRGRDGGGDFHRPYINDNHKVMNEPCDVPDVLPPPPPPHSFPHPHPQHHVSHPYPQHNYPHHNHHPISPVQEHPSPPPSQISTAGGEDAFTRELQRQKSDYDRRKKLAEQIRIQQEEEEKEERRRAAVRLQEEQQRLLQEKQREDQRQKEKGQLQEELRKQEEETHRREEEIRQQEEATRRQEEQRKMEETRQKEEVVRKQEEQKATDMKKQSKKQIQIQSSNSFKEEKKISNNSQYRRTSSDSVRKASTNHVNNSNVDNNNYINRNGIGSQDSINSNSSSTTQTLSPTNNSHNPSPCTASSNPSIARLHTADKKSTPTGSPVVRRAKVGDKTTTSAGRPSGRTTPNSTTPRSQTSTPTTRRNNLTPQTKTKSQSKGIPVKAAPKEEEFKKKHQALQNKHIHESQTLRKRLEAPQKKTGVGTPPINSHTNNSTPTNRSRTGLSANTMKLLEEYKEANPNFTIRRHHEQQQEEIEHLEQLRQTIESRLKVTLPDNLPDALRDGVVLCHLANQIRPRSVASIHVPSPAVPKLTMAKCRRNVENFLEACRKIGVSQEQICSVHDILEEKSVIRVAITAGSLVAIGTNPKQSVV
ncbi:hypothetical protein SNE40_021316 [Patella caerulea]|uniref:Calponin-homology (CH) domain-containing protein n=1 Tax=Patella caerulea TaxID=87958 RepID=A0AAN8GIL6_PATCE